jgi:hypothetical protein
MVALVLAASAFFDASSRVHSHSSLGCTPARIYLRTFDPALTTTPLSAAAWTGLGSAPESRPRWAYHHLPRSLSTRLGLHIATPPVCFCSTPIPLGLIDGRPLRPFSRAISSRCAATICFSSDTSLSNSTNRASRSARNRLDRSVGGAIPQPNRTRPRRGKRENQGYPGVLPR